MKFKREQPSEVMPPVGQLIDVLWVQDGLGYSMAAIDIIDLDTMREEAEKKNGAPLLGKPTVCALVYDGKSSILEIFPTPDADLEIRVRFYPPAVEI